MGVKTTNVTTSSGLDILKTLKEMLGTGWTLDENNLHLWKDSPAAFPVGIVVHNESTKTFIRPMVKGPTGNPYYATASNMALAYVFTNTSAITIYISVYTSPNGSIAIGFSNNSSVIVPTLLIAKNANTDSGKPQNVLFATGANRNMLLPGIADYSSMPTLSISYPSGSEGQTFSLMNAADPYTGTALNDIYYLTAYQGSRSPMVLVNGSDKYILVTSFTDSGCRFYMRYI